MKFKDYKQILTTGSLLVATSILLFTNCAKASSFEVELTPKTKITTANTGLSVGDSVDFVTTKDVYDKSKLLVEKGTPFTGIITHIHDNGFHGEYAEITIGQLTSDNIHLTGSIYADAREHSLVAEIFTRWIRGAEVTLRPNKNCYNLILKEKP